MNLLTKPPVWLGLILQIVFVLAQQYEQDPVDTENVVVAVTICKPQDGSSQLRKSTLLNNFDRQYNHVLTLLKSLLITWNRSNIHHDSLNFIIFSNTLETNHRIQSEVDSWNLKNKELLNLSFRNATYPAGFETLEGLFSTCGSLQLFMPELLPDYDKIIYLDTDVVMLRDIRDLWKYFEKFNDATVIAAAPGIGRPGTICLRQVVNAMRIRMPKSRPKRRNPGVLLMDLRKLRQSNWKEWLQKVSQYRKEISGCPPQAIINTYMYQHPRSILHLPTSWNFYSAFLGKSTKPGHISAIHGTSGALLYRGTVFNEIYSEFRKTDLRHEIKLPLFVESLKSVVEKRKFHQCSKQHSPQTSVNCSFSAEKMGNDVVYHMINQI